MAKEYLKDVIGGAGFYIFKNPKADKDKFTYDPTIQIDGYKKDVHNKISEILTDNKISHSKKIYEGRFGLSYRIIITSMYNINQLYEIVGTDFKTEREKIFFAFLETRLKKLATNKKARYGEEENNLYRQLRVINGELNTCRTQRIKF